ncbi:hypothetical protein [Portibacter marinus]|uniref:hypothetical protein n=1 Tax=Portibacter marinus TaxID=2898660 RepID=UPI001F2DEA4E|nr:hypothetical protein [Portibacter marinus]
MKQLPIGVGLDTLYQSAFIIGPLKQAVFPLLDAAIFNQKLQMRSDEIMNLQQEDLAYIENLLRTKLQEIVPIVRLRSQFNSKNTHPSASFQVKVDNQHFPVIFYAKDSDHLINFSTRNEISSMSLPDSISQSNIQNHTLDHDIPTSMIIYNRLAVLNSSVLGISGNMRLETYIFIYDRNGRLLIELHGFTKPELIKGNRLKEIENIWHQYDLLAEMIKEKLQEILIKN